MEMKIYKEAEVTLSTSFDWREGWVSTAANVGSDTIAEYVANEGVRIYLNNGWDEHSLHNDEDADDFIGVKTPDGIISLADWMSGNDETSSVEHEFCEEIAKAYADYVLEGVSSLKWKSDRGFANAGWYWTDDGEDIEEAVDTDDPDEVWDLETNREIAKGELVRWYSEVIYKRRNPAAFVEQSFIRLPDDTEFIMYTF
jgi:hypothetical protein